MTVVDEFLPLASTVEPTTQEELVAQVREAYETATPVYTIGGGTSLDFGLPGKQQGIGLRMTAINRIVDYPDRDMTITVEAGITMAALTAELARHGQRLPVDAAQAAQATLGGLIATNFSGPRRYGYGTLRDYVIGISAVDGRGTPFKSGGRVVKNVAGYDLCKLLTGSLGTLAVITQATLKVRPIAPATTFVACDIDDWQRSEEMLAGIVTSRTTPVAVEVVCGPHWRTEPMLTVPQRTIGRLLVGFEGNSSEVEWQVEQLSREWREGGVTNIDVQDGASAQALWVSLIDFAGGTAPLVLKANLRPSAVIGFTKLLSETDPQVSLQAHAGNGIVLAHFSEFSPNDAARILIQQLQPAAVAAGGNVIVWSCPAGDLTRQAAWGAAPSDAPLMRAVKKQFDPKGILNPGRFWFR